MAGSLSIGSSIRVDRACVCAIEPGGPHAAAGCRPAPALPETGRSRCVVEQAPWSGRRGFANMGRTVASAVTPPRLRALCLGFPGAVEEFPFGELTSVFKVGGKMFALSRLSGRPLQVSVKCDPDLGAQLRATYEAIVPGYHLNKRHWLTISVTEVPDELVCELLAGSYELVLAALPRSKRATLRA